MLEQKNDIDQANENNTGNKTNLLPTLRKTFYSKVVFIETHENSLGKKTT